MKIMKFETYAYALGYFTETPDAMTVVVHPDKDGTWAVVMYGGGYAVEED